MKNKKDIALRYDSSAEIYDNRYQEIQKQKYQEIFSRVDIRASKSIIDIGCGTGSFLGIIHDSIINGTKMIGIDISLEMIKKAHKKYPEIDFIVADSDSLPFRDNTFSNIFSITVLQNLPEPETSFQEIHRISKEQAKIAISILRKTWSMGQLQQITINNKLTLEDSWIAEVEDIGVLCTKIS